MNDASNIQAVIVAAGRGSRFGGELPKQFCDFLGRPMLMTTIERFAKVIGLSHISVVIDPAMLELWLSLCEKHCFVSPKIVSGGPTRAQSVRNAIMEMEACDNDVVLIHDGARPLISCDLIRRMSLVPDGCAGAVPVVKVTDSIRETGPSGNKAVDRSKFVAVQTPQSFFYKTLRKAYENLNDSDAITDDASAVERIDNSPIALIEGEVTNIKVTNPSDLVVAEALARLSNSTEQQCTLF